MPVVVVDEALAMDNRLPRAPAGYPPLPARIPVVRWGSGTRRLYYYALDDVDITFGGSFDWALTEEVEAYCEDGAYAIEPLATETVGEFWRLSWLNHGYADWGQDSCDTSRNEPDAEWMAVLTALYGPYVAFSTQDARAGALPLDICFELTVAEKADASAVQWDFGDGGGSSETDPCHSYEEAGLYSVAATISDDSGYCGGGAFTYRQADYVLACDEPAPGYAPSGERYGGLFTYEHEEGLPYQLVNRTDTSVYGCLDTVIWQIYDEDGAMQQELGAWSPRVEFPEEGGYRVLLNVGGPGGMSAADLTIDTTLDGRGCSSAPVGVDLLALFGSLGLALGRRRRQQSIGQRLHRTRHWHRSDRGLQRGRTTSTG